jgi:hypothetical protein
MEIQGDLAQLYAGMPLVIQGANVAMEQPKLRDIIAFGEDDFLTCVQLFTHADVFAKRIRQGNPQLAMLDDFQLLLVIIREDKEQKKIIQEFFDLLFPSLNIEIVRGCINFKMKEEPRIIGRLDSFCFESFQKVLTQAFIPSKSGEEEVEYNPANAQAAEIAAKLKRGNEIRNKLRAQENNVKSLYTNYISALGIGLAMDINIFLDYTSFQLFDAFKRYTIKMSYDLYQRVSTMPMMDTSKMKEPDNWLDDLYK